MIPACPLIWLSIWHDAVYIIHGYVPMGPPAKKRDVRDASVNKLLSFFMFVLLGDDVSKYYSMDLWVFLLG